MARSTIETVNSRDESRDMVRKRTKRRRRGLTSLLDRNDLGCRWVHAVTVLSDSDVGLGAKRRSTCCHPITPLRTTTSKDSELPV